MAYDETLAIQVSKALVGVPNLVEKKMFGGIGYLVNGNMACGVHKDLLIVRVGPNGYQDALEQPHTSVFDITGRPMTGWVTVSKKALRSDVDIGVWVGKGLDFVSSLPPK